MSQDTKDTLVFAIFFVIPNAPYIFYLYKHTYIRITWTLDRSQNPNIPSPMWRTTDSQFVARLLIFSLLNGFSTMANFVLLQDQTRTVVTLGIFAALGIPFGLYGIRYFHQDYPLQSAHQTPTQPSPGEISETARKIIDELSKRP
jgi:hypothetical protein